MFKTGIVFIFSAGLY